MIKFCVFCIVLTITVLILMARETYKNTKCVNELKQIIERRDHMIMVLHDDLKVESEYVDDLHQEIKELKGENNG